MSGDGSAPLDLGFETARLFEALPEASFVVDGSRIEAVNERFVEMLGHDPTGGEVRATIPHWREGRLAETPFEAELRCPGGGGLPVEVRVRALDGERAVVSVRDARELIAGREAAVALVEAEARYRSLVEQIPAVVYADDGNVTEYVNPQIEQILGVSPEAYRADPDMWLRMVHPEDRDRVEAQSRAFIAGEGGDLEDYRMVRPDGRIVWVRDRAYAHRDAEGRAVFEHGILFDVTELKDAEARVAHMAYHDGLTSLANRQLFEQTLILAVERAKRDETSVAVVFLDLDNFKLVNDSLGHHAGDLLLCELADRLRTSTRETDLVARQGGDEFLMLLADLDPSEAEAAATRVAHRVTEALAHPFGLQGTEFHARGSIGVSVYPRDALDAETLLKNADIAMYRAKRIEPGGHMFFAVEGDDAMSRLSFEQRLRHAVEAQEWVLHFQPVVDLADRRVVGAEALIRWQDHHGIVPPGEFIPVAEELGLIEAIGDWVIDEVATQQRAWRDAGLDLEVSFNLSPRQLWTPRLADRLLHEAARRRCRPIDRAGRDHRVDGDGRPRPHATHPARAALMGAAAGARRLRHGILIALATQAHARRRVEDRPGVHPPRRPRRAPGRHGARDDPGGAVARHGAARRGCRERERVRVPTLERLPAGPGLLVRASDARRGARGDGLGPPAVLRSAPLAPDVPALIATDLVAAQPVVPHEDVFEREAATARVVDLDAGVPIPSEDVVHDTHAP